MKRKAVALKYDRQKNRVPQVIAKGVDNLADRIMEIARQHGVALYEDQALVKKLYSLEVGEDIPEEFYQVVAVLLAWVYSLDKKEAR